MSESSEQTSTLASKKDGNTEEDQLVARCGITIEKTTTQVEADLVEKSSKNTAGMCQCRTPLGLGPLHCISTLFSTFLSYDFGLGIRHHIFFSRYYLQNNKDTSRGVAPYQKPRPSRGGHDTRLRKSAQ